MTIDETYPMRLFYDVSLKAGVEEKLANPDAQLKSMALMRIKMRIIRYIS